MWKKEESTVITRILFLTHGLGGGRVEGRGRVMDLSLTESWKDCGRKETRAEDLELSFLCVCVCVIKFY